MQNVQFSSDGGHTWIDADPTGGWFAQVDGSNGTPVFTFSLWTPGTYNVLCTIAGHSEAGMKTTITVAQ